MQISNEDYQLFRPLLFSIGYRMLGSIGDAEDIVQETFLKAYQMDEQQINNIKAYLCKMMTNRCLDYLKSARYKRENYVGPWNPEPLLVEKSNDLDPSDVALQTEGLSIAYLRMMEHLTPDERAVLLLREVFDFTYLEIASMIEKNEDNCRKIYSRSKQKIARIESESLNYENNKSIINRFIQAFEMKNTNVLLELVSENVTLYSDGGGKVNAATRPITSLSNVLALLYGIAKKAPKDFYFEIRNVNGQPAMVNYMNGSLQSIISFYISDEKINEVYIMMNPDKLPKL
ncbi:RNA polymerase subunit sigma [Bacillus sp. FJAT-22090]|uniref:RNA polymerase sigma-70 factor n=1 Tax=Bacillus sp. FJAT-22090 TaxID=1581038 RepID=UPI0006AE9C66|nr:RNA polymerase sigma-70 factor [Bacillus sp. FJAT-22090]ALC87924.1 RNA polymerase subunit sigma [Bacillus sp. FJAT-22090]